MLAFSSYIDAHFHLACCSKKMCDESFVNLKNSSFSACTCSHDVDEFLLQEKLIEEKSYEQNVKLISAFGLHPQKPLTKNIPFMEKLLQEKRIFAIGETGFDFFAEYKENEKQQQEAWNACLELATKYNVPIVIHSRKALHKIFADSKKLKNVCAVVFHSFTGSVNEANAFLNRGVNAYFSFGNPLIFGDKSARLCVRELPLNRLLLETDAPYQCMRGETETRMDAIRGVYDFAFSLRCGSASEFYSNEFSQGDFSPNEFANEFADAISKNFDSVFRV